MQGKLSQISNPSLKQSLQMLKPLPEKLVDGQNPTGNSLRSKSNARSVQNVNWQNWENIKECQILKRNFPSLYVLIDVEDNVRASSIGRRRESIPSKSLGWVSKILTLFAGIVKCMSCTREISRYEQIVTKCSEFRYCESLVMNLDWSKKPLRGSATFIWNALRYPPLAKQI